MTTVTVATLDYHSLTSGANHTDRSSIIPDGQRRRTLFAYSIAVETPTAQSRDNAAIKRTYSLDDHLMFAASNPNVDGSLLAPKS